MTSRYSCARSYQLGFIALGLGLFACGGASDGSQNRKDPVIPNEVNTPGNGAQPPVTAGALEPGSPGTSDGSEELPISSGADPAAGGTSLNIDELLATPNCASGWLPQDPESEPECAATFSSICFQNDEDACSCAGCGADACLIAESYPTQISCETQILGCNFTWFDACFETAEEACAAAGCGENECIIAESYPAQVSCE